MGVEGLSVRRRQRRDCVVDAMRTLPQQSSQQAGFAESAADAAKNAEKNREKLAVAATHRLRTKKAPIGEMSMPPIGGTMPRKRLR